MFLFYFYHLLVVLMIILTYNIHLHLKRRRLFAHVQNDCCLFNSKESNHTTPKDFLCVFQGGHNTFTFR